MLNIATTAAPIRKRRERLEDAPFIDALDFDFRNATTIARHMLANGTPASLPTIAKRMKEFAAYTVEIETKGNSWRLAPSAPANDNDDTPPPPAPSNGIAPRNRKARRAAKALETVEAPANDNLTPLALNTLHHGDCLELMKAIPDKSVDLVLCDLPYGSCGGRSKSGANIDMPIDLGALWTEYRRILAPSGNIVLFGEQLFTADLMNAGRDWFSDRLSWRKDKPTGYQLCRKRPLSDFEDIVVFRNKKHRSKYNPWRATETLKPNNPAKNKRSAHLANRVRYNHREMVLSLSNCPRSTLEYAKERIPAGGNPYRKPLALLDDLIRMYSNTCDVVLDNCVGSGSTAVAAIGAGRQWIAIEQDKDCFAEATGRIEAALAAKDALPPANALHQPDTLA